MCGKVLGWMKCSLGATATSLFSKFFRTQMCSLEFELKNQIFSKAFCSWVLLTVQPRVAPTIGHTETTLSALHLRKSLLFLSFISTLTRQRLSRENTTELCIQRLTLSHDFPLSPFTLPPNKAWCQTLERIPLQWECELTGDTAGLEKEG